MTNQSNIFNNSFEDKPVFDITDKQADVPVNKKQIYINDFDSSLILENINKKTSNKAVLINLKINALERNLARISEELELLELLNLEKDESKRQALIEFKLYLQTELLKFKKERTRFGIIYSITDFFKGKIDIEKITDKVAILKNEILKYDKLNITNLKLKTTDLLPFKW